MKTKGFSLIELLVALVIIGILTAIILPTYRAYIIRSNVNDAFSGLSTYSVQMAQYYSDNGNYGTNNTCGVAMAATSYFTYACTLGNNGQTYTITATGNGTSVITSSYVYTIDDANNRTTTGFPGATVPATCWLSQAGSC